MAIQDASQQQDSEFRPDDISGGGMNSQTGSAAGKRAFATDAGGATEPAQGAGGAGAAMVQGEAIDQETEEGEDAQQR